MSTTRSPSVAAAPIPADPLAELAGVLASVLDQARTVIGSVGPGDLTLPTPCPGWDVGVVRDHLVGALEMFASATAGPGPRAAGERPSERPSERLEAAGSAALRGWAGLPATATVDLPFGTFPVALGMTINVVETFVHTCDLAVALGRTDLISRPLCADVRRRACAAGFDAFRLPGMFGTEVPSPSTDELDRLLAYTGRVRA